MKRLVISQYVGLLGNFKIGFEFSFTIILIGGYWLILEIMFTF